MVDISGGLSSQCPILPLHIGGRATFVPLKLFLGFCQQARRGGQGLVYEGRKGGGGEPGEGGG